MKSLGAVMAFTNQRNQALLLAYRRIIRDVPFVSLAEIGELLVNSPSPRFWVSEERAAAVVSALLRNKPVLETMRPTKQEMFREIFKRVTDLRQQQPDWTLLQLVSVVINQPAPKFYMKASSAIERLYKIRNGWYQNARNGK